MASEADREAAGGVKPKSPSSSPRDAAFQAQQQLLPLDAQNTLEADPNAADADADDGYETDSTGSARSTSLSSGVRDYVFENNRRYHKFREGRYLVPNDEPEQEREDMKHMMVVNVCDGKLHFAPLQDPQKILDIGTGTGIWVVDMADEYPGAEVTGIDLSPIQPTWVPPNVRFYVDDAESEWAEGENKLDYVHARHICMAIKNWPRLLTQAYKAIKPGGWIELQELRLVVHCDDGTMPADYPVAQFLDNLREGFGKFGVDLLSLDRNQELLRDAGFENVEEKVWKIPVGAWASDRRMKTIGQYNRCVIHDALEGVSMAPYTRGLRWTREEVEVFLVGVRKALANPSVHSYYTFHAVYGQKPPDAE